METTFWILLFNWKDIRKRDPCGPKEEIYDRSPWSSSSMNTLQGGCDRKRSDDNHHCYTEQEVVKLQPQEILPIITSRFDLNCYIIILYDRECSSALKL